LETFNKLYRGYGTKNIAMVSVLQDLTFETPPPSGVYLHVVQIEH